MASQKPTNNKVVESDVYWSCTPLMLQNEISVNTETELEGGFFFSDPKRCLRVDEKPKHRYKAYPTTVPHQECEHGSIVGLCLMWAQQCGAQMCSKFQTSRGAHCGQLTVDPRGPKDCIFDGYLSRFKKHPHTQTILFFPD